MNTPKIRQTTQKSPNNQRPSNEWVVGICVKRSPLANAAIASVALAPTICAPLPIKPLACVTRGMSTVPNAQPSSRQYQQNKSPWCCLDVAVKAKHCGTEEANHQPHNFAPVEQS
jgi:hypothetical protein